ncbi:MAG TPA: response regulator transcription factor [Burkholderiales bacterium]|jgi:DNA-binding NarL/FixJ family response regulator|nr:response regulator transcription factor [Burkholderiales bacterium]
MKVLVVDDHALIREALRGVLKELKDDATIVEASSGREALSLLGDHPDFSLILLDLNLPDRNGFAVLAELRERYPAVATVVLSAFSDRENIARALDLGALGFIPKSGSRSVMLGALRLVLSGGIYIPPDILAQRETSPAEPKAGRPARDGRPLSPRDAGLTERQVEVLALMMQGKSNKAICRILDLAEPTVKNHVTAILKSLKVTNRTEAVIAVGDLGWDLRSTAGR